MKIIPKGLYGLITLSDNTRVAKPIILERIPYKLKPNEFYFIDKKTGKKTLVKRKLETIYEDKRNKYLRLLDLSRAKQILKLLEQDKNYEKGALTIDALTKLTLPSTYIGPLFNNNGKSYTDNLISGEGTGNTGANLAIDLFSLKAWLKLYQPRNLKRFASFNLSSPLKNGLWDMPTITLQIKKGGSKAVDFLGSQTRLDTYNYNRNLANRLGFGNIEEPYNSIARVRKPFQVKFNTNTLSNEGGSFIPGKTALLDIIEINLSHDIEPAAFHETLHRGSYGMGSLEGLDNMTEFRNTNRFYEYLSDKLKKPWSLLPTSMRDYLDKPGELPVNVLELGQRMGIQVGLKYPGKTKFNAIIDLFKRNNPNDGKLFILDYLNMDKPKRVWDALSGLYFTALPAIYGGYKATEE